MRASVGPLLLASLLATVGAACAPDTPDLDLARDLDLGDRFECIEWPPDRVGERGLVAARIRCSGGWTGCVQRHVPVGMRVTVELDLAELPADAELELDVEGARGGLRRQQDPCSQSPIATGELRFQTPGRALLRVRADGEQVDLLDWEIEVPVALELELPRSLNVADAAFDREASTLTVGVGETIVVAAYPVGASGMRLGTRGDIGWMLEAPGVASVLGGGAPGIFAEIVALRAGRTTLRVQQGELSAMATLVVVGD
jgi:hypothetical protein